MFSVWAINASLCPTISWMHRSVSLHLSGRDHPLGVFFKPINGFDAHLGFIRDAGVAGRLRVHVASSSTHGGKNQSAGWTKVTPDLSGARNSKQLPFSRHLG